MTHLCCAIHAIVKHRYNLLHPKRTCKLVNHVEQYPRVHLLVSTVLEHLKKTAEHDAIIGPQDVPCFSCYKLHCNSADS